MKINVKNLRKYYHETEVLKGINFALETGDQCVIKGASGSGKSTFLYLLGGLECIDEGHIMVGDLPLHDCNDGQLASYRNRCLGFVFQFHFLLSSMKVLDNIYLPARIGRGLTEEVKDRVEDSINRLGLMHCLKKYPHELSGGEQQRVNIARACSLAPRVLLCDEPSGSLDSENTHRVVELLKDISGDFNLSLIIVTHDILVSQHFSQILTMHDGFITY